MNSLLKVFFVGLIFFAIHAGAELPLAGTWKFSAMIYRGQVVPPLNPDLLMTWTFFANGTERLFWQRKGEVGFCERFAHFEFNQSELKEKVFALNPKNRFDCSSDPDMQLGREASTKLKLEADRILLYLSLSDEELIYILTPL